MDVLADHRVVAGIAHDVYAAEECNGREHGVRTVEKSNLTLVVGSLGVGDEHLKTGLLGGKLGAELLDGHVGSALDNPEVECLALNNDVVLVAEFLLDLGNLLAGESGNDAVNEGSAYVVVGVEPVLEALVIRSEILFPELDVLVDDLLEMVTVLEDKLAGHDDEAD